MTTISDAPLFPNDNSVYSSGETIYISGRSFRLGEMLGHGGQGIVFELEGKSGIVVKLYHKNVLNKRLIEQLKLIVHANLRSETLVAPIDLVWDSPNKNIIGFTMDYVRGKKLDSVLIGDGDKYNKLEIVRLAYNIVKAYHKLDSKSSHKILAGDINLNNIMVYEKTKVKIIDLDSIQIDDFPCPVGFAGFNHPTAIGKNYRTFLRTEHNEQFALAVLIFFILIYKHPFAQLNGQGDDYNVKNLPFRYICDEKAIQNIPIHYVYRWSTLTQELQQLFVDVFSTAKTQYPKLVTFEQWEKELGDYEVTLVHDIKANKLLNVWLLTVDPFSNAKVCLYCEKEFVPVLATDELCPNCKKLNLEKVRCANSFCANPLKSYYIPVAKAPFVRYCSDCLQTYISSCKSCGCEVVIKKYELHTFDGAYCDIHRPPAKGRLTKAKNTIAEYEGRLICMFRSGKYFLYIVDEALKNFKHSLVNLLKDENIEEVTPLIEKVKDLIREFVLYGDDYRRWFGILEKMSNPQTSSEIESNLKILHDNLTSFETLSKKRQDKDIPFKKAMGYKYLVSFYNAKIGEIEKIHFKKCSCCGKEVRDDSWMSGAEYYCSDCMKEYVYSCRHCNTKYLKPRYLHDRDKLGIFCNNCASEVRQLSDTISKIDARDFEEMGSFERINFANRREHFNNLFNAISRKTESYKKSNCTIPEFKKLEEQAELVRNEEKYLEEHRKTLCYISTIKLETCSYPDLKKLQKQLTSIKNSITSTNKISDKYSFTVASLAPVPKALYSIENKSREIKQLIKEKENYLNNSILAFNMFKDEISNIDGYIIDWDKRESYIKETTDRYRLIFEEFCFDNVHAQNNLDFIRNELPALTGNEQNFYKGPLQILAYYDGAKYSTSDSSAIDATISEIKWQEDFLNKRGSRFILNQCILKKVGKIKARIELMKSILDGSFYADVNAYITRPIKEWNIMEIPSLTTGRVIDEAIPDDFKLLVEKRCKGMLSASNTYNEICNDINIYIGVIEKDFWTGYDEDFLTKNIPSKVKSLVDLGYNVSGIDPLIAKAQNIEETLKRKCVAYLNMNASLWKESLSYYVLLLFSNLYVIGQGTIGYYITDTRTYQGFLLSSISSGILCFYIAIASFNFYRKKKEISNNINFLLISIGSILNYAFFFFYDANIEIGFLGLLGMCSVCIALFCLIKKKLIKMFRYKLNPLAARIMKKDSI